MLSSKSFWFNFAASPGVFNSVELISDRPENLSKPDYIFRLHDYSTHEWIPFQKKKKKRCPSEKWTHLNAHVHPYNEWNYLFSLKRDLAMVSIEERLSLSNVIPFWQSPPVLRSFSDLFSALPEFIFVISHLKSQLKV